MDGHVFFYVGPALVVAALILSAIGIRGESSFPPSRPVMVGLTLLFLAIVVGTTSLAVVNARNEKDDRDAEMAEQQEQAAAEQSAAPQGGGATPAKGAATKLDLTSPADGSLMFDPDSLEAPAGMVTISYENPSPVPHNINIEGDGGAVAGSEDVTNGTAEITAQLAPGQYTYFCSIPGHRQAGMEGDLLVQ